MFIKNTFKFIARNPRLVLMALIPALPLGFFASPSAIIPFLFNYKPSSGNTLTIGKALHQLFPMHEHPLWVLLLIPLAFVFCAVIFGISEHKMRVGNYGFRNFFQSFFQRMNFSVTALIIPFILVCILYTLWLFLSACVLVFFEFICFKLMGSAALSVIFVAVFTVLLYLLLIWMFSLLLLWPPVTLVSGYGVMDSWFYQLRLLEGRMFKFTVSIALVFFINGALVTSFGLFLGRYAMAAVSAVCFTFMIIYLIGLAMTAYFDLSGTARKDIKIKYYLRKHE